MALLLYFKSKKKSISLPYATYGITLPAKSSIGRRRCSVFSNEDNYEQTRVFNVAAVFRNRTIKSKY